MLSQDIIQAYRNDNDEAVIIVGKFNGLGNEVILDSVVIPFSDLKTVAKAIDCIAEEIMQELI